MLSRTQDRLSDLAELSENSGGEMGSRDIADVKIYGIKYGSVFLQKFLDVIYKANQRAEPSVINIFMDRNLDQNKEITDLLKDGLNLLEIASNIYSKFAELFPDCKSKITIKAILCSSNQYSAAEVMPFSYEDLPQIKILCKNSSSGKLAQDIIEDVFSHLNLKATKELSNMFSLSRNHDNNKSDKLLDIAEKIIGKCDNIGSDKTIQQKYSIISSDQSKTLPTACNGPTKLEMKREVEAKDSPRENKRKSCKEEGAKTHDLRAALAVENRNEGRMDLSWCNLIFSCCVVPNATQIIPL